MSQPTYNLAIETSTRDGQVALGECDRMLATATLDAAGKHDASLVAAIDSLCREHDVAPGQLGEIYLSIGPGSFTGLRVAVSVVKMLARVLGVKVVGVPTAEVIARNVEHDDLPLVVCLNTKGTSVYATRFEHDGQDWRVVGEPEVCDIFTLLPPVMVVGEKLPVNSDTAVSPLTRLGSELARPRVETVYALGYAMARAGRFTDAFALAPRYARRPEAVSLWEKRQQQVGQTPAGK